MKKQILLSFFSVTFFIVSFDNSFAQQLPRLFVPENIKAAYKNGTRALDGKPGKNYWINSSDYIIKAELFPETRTIKGREWITFHNNSPDTLKTFMFRLYQNIFKEGGAREFPVDKRDLTNGVNIDTLIIDGNGYSLNERSLGRFGFRSVSTNYFIRKLVKPIPPNSIAKVETEWSFVIPKYSRNRMGAYNDSTFYVAYWYPQIAVYDDIDGWDRQEFTGTTEFYNDFNNYNVEITVPGNFLVRATGELKNAQEVLDSEVYNRYKSAFASDTVIHIITSEDLKNSTAVKNGQKNTWKYSAEHVPDFSFCATGQYLWDGVSVVVDNSTGRRVFTDAVYPEGAAFWNEVASFARQSVEYFSKEQPGVPFPYPKITVFNGERNRGGGMETPMMCNNGQYRTRGGQLGVTAHEIAHTYFPFYMGINERKYAWMDEGWATYFTYGVVKKEAPDEDEFPGTVHTLSVALPTEAMIPPMILSYEATGGSGYTLMAYPHAAFAYTMLRDILGKDVFAETLHEYIKRWNGKHPTPYDFFNTFDNASGKNLNWFWKPWFFEKDYADLAIKNVEADRSVYKVVIENIGGLPLPVNLKLTYEDGKEDSIYNTAEVWKDNNDEITINIPTKGKIKKIELGCDLIPDSDKSNNTYDIE